MLIYQYLPLLSCTHLRKAVAKSYCLFREVCPSVRMEHLGCHTTDVREN
jgi:hypothetical protein